MSVDDVVPEPHPLAVFSPLFAYERGVSPADAVPLRALCERPVLGRWTDYVGASLAAMAEQPVEYRVAASTASLGLFARLVSPVLGAAALGEPVPAPDGETTWVQPVSHGSWLVGLTGDAVAPDPAAVVSDVLLPVAATLADRTGLSRHILRGNLTAAVFGATGVVMRSRPDLAEGALARALALLDGPLAGTGSYRERFVRSSCCLYYRIPGGGYCGECVLAARRAG